MSKEDSISYMMLDRRSIINLGKRTFLSQNLFFIFEKILLLNGGQMGEKDGGGRVVDMYAQDLHKCQSV